MESAGGRVSFGAFLHPNLGEGCFQAQQGSPEEERN